jgi:hypothetical protein
VGEAPARGFSAGGASRQPPRFVEGGQLCPGLLPFGLGHALLPRGGRLWPALADGADDQGRGVLGVP